MRPMELALASSLSKFSRTCVRAGAARLVIPNAALRHLLGLAANHPEQRIGNPYRGPQGTPNPKADKAARRAGLVAVQFWLQVSVPLANSKEYAKS
jgi:hypothetical protein